MPDSTSTEKLTQSIDEIRAAHEGEWLLVKILDTGVPLGQSRGELLAHGPSRMAMFKAEKRFRKNDRSSAVAIVAGGADFTDGDAFRRELARIAAEEEPTSLSVW